MDANGNGVLELNEVPEERRGMLRFMASRMGIDPEKPIPLDQVRETMIRRFGDREGGQGPSGSEEQGSAKSAEEPAPLVPAFGEEQELPRVPEFGERVQHASLFSSTSQSALSKMDPERASRIRGFAEAMLRRYDRNQSNVLERDEWEGMRVAQGADRNNDGKITLDEIIARLAEYSERRSRESDRGSSDDSQNSGESGSGNSNGRKSYRFLSAAERLVEGLPDWFARYDANGDGQVAMAEYSSDWSDDKAREFDRYDLNGDGLITQRECLNAGDLPVGLAGPIGGPPRGPMGLPPGPIGGAPRGPAGEPSRGPARAPPEAPKDQGGATPWWMQ